MQNLNTVANNNNNNNINNNNNMLNITGYNQIANLNTQYFLSLILKFNLLNYEK